MPALASVDIWIWDQDAVAARDAERLRAIMSADERQRALRFVFVRNQLRHVAGRGVLRRILAHYAETNARELTFETGAHGKPSLAPGHGTLHFNLSHSGGLAALAVSRDTEMGIDVERIRPFTEDVAERFFAPGEVAALRALPEGEQLDAFYRIWTRKEAFLKATGDGLLRPLDSFEVTVARADAPRFVRIDGVADPAASWALADFDVADGFAGALAMPKRRADERIEVRRRSLDEIV
jgi:4'-phosphopantetheinyl transferase